jgi:NTE family protein
VTTHPIRGVALAGGGPLGAIYEIGALLALSETLRGFDATGCDVYVGVSSGAFIAAGLANGLSPKSMHRMFIESDAADDPFEPELLLRPALGEYANRLASLPGLLALSVRKYVASAGTAGIFECFGQVAHALPTGVFDNAGVGDYLTQLLSAPRRTNDFRQLRRKLFLVATDIDTGAATPFGAEGRDDVPISRAVQASSALSGLFPPVEIDGRYYVDGALTKTLHASVALRQGAKLLLCINPLVPFDARLAAEHAHRSETSIVHGGLPAIMAQTFRTLIHSRMRVSMERYHKEYPDADVLLFEPERDDVEMFFTNVFSYSDRRRLCEHAYQRTREDLRRRRSQLEEALGRHGITIDDQALADEHRTLLVRHRKTHRRTHPLEQTAAKLDLTLDQLQRLLSARGAPEEDQPAN